MKKRILSFVVCLCMVAGLLPTVALATDGEVSYRYCDDGTGEWKTGAKLTSEYTIIESGTTGWSSNTTGGWYVVSGDVTIGSRVTVSGNVHLILTDGCHLQVTDGITVQDDDNDPATPSPNTLTIYGQTAGTGKLTADAADKDTYNAGIGGEGDYNSVGFGGSGGTVNIHGGTVMAKSTTGAGIGGGWGTGTGGSGGTVNIYGGTVTAESQGGAGIGGGNSSGLPGSSGGSGGTVNIHGGTVTAKSNSGAGIGGGYDSGSGGSGGTVNIYGGTVTAESNPGAGIGGGSGSTGGSGGTVNIHGGTVTAESYGGAGIGGGSGGSSGGGGTVHICGGTVTAESVYGAGIGGGSDGINGGTLTLDGNGWVAASSVQPVESDLTFNSGVLFTKSATGTMTNSVTPGYDCEVPENKTLTIPAGQTLTIPAGVTLTNKGTIEGAGTLTGEGTFAKEGSGVYTLKVSRSISAPEVSGKTSTSVTLNEVAAPTGGGTVQYAKSGNNTAPTDGWQAGTEFTGLSNDVIYYFFSHVEEEGIYKAATSTGTRVILGPYLEAEDITFDALTAGYTQPDPQPIAIINSGETAANVNSVTLSGDNADSFTLNQASGSTSIAAGAEDKTYTVQPNANLAAGTHTATITITYDSGKAATAAVLFTVNAAPSSSGSSNTKTPTQQAVQKLEKAEPGDTVAVTLPSTGKLPAEILQTAAGKDVVLQISAGSGLTWLIDGKDIPSGISALNLAVKTNADTIPADVINALTGEKKTIQLELAHTGEFGLTLVLRLSIGAENAGLWANLYHYNEDAGKLEYQSAAKVDADGSADLPFTHASDYAVVLDDENHAPVNPFTDVTEGDWFYDAVLWAVDMGVTTGTSDTTFSPDAAMNRAMVVTQLYRMEGSPAVSSRAAFTDVPADRYYADAVAWATANGIVTGYSAAQFGPDDTITREQTAAILHRYAQYKSWDVSVGEDTNILGYADFDQISEYAIPAMQWAVGAGVIAGTAADTLSPKATATRAQVVTILHRVSADR